MRRTAARVHYGCVESVRDDSLSPLLKRFRREEDAAAMEELVRRVQAHPAAPEILLLERTLDNREMAGLYTACDLLVHPYRGEGFGMPVLEARASGLPMVITKGGSTDDFCSGEACLGVPAVRRLVDLPGVHIGRPFVLEPDAEAFGVLVRDAVARLGTLRGAAVRDASAVRSEHGWDRAAEHIERMAFRALDPGDRTDSPDLTRTMAKVTK